MKKTRDFNFWDIGSCYAYSMLLGMVFFALAGIPKEKLWWGALWAATFLSLIIPAIAMLTMVDEILQARNPRKK